MVSNIGVTLQDGVSKKLQWYFVNSGFSEQVSQHRQPLIALCNLIVNDIFVVEVVNPMIEDYCTEMIKQGFAVSLVDGVPVVTKFTERNKK